MYDILIFSLEFEVGSNMKGIGYRMWELAQVLAHAYDFKVGLVLRDETDFSEAGIEIVQADNSNLDDLIKSSRNILITYGISKDLKEKIVKSKKPVILDSLMTPLESLDYQYTRDLENIKKQNKFFYNELENYKELLNISDYYLVGSYEEKEIMIGQLLMLGRISVENYRNINNIIDIVPIGFNKQSLKKSPENAQVVKGGYLWNGGVWNHYNIDNLIESFSVLSKKSSEYSIKFLYPCKTKTYKKIVDYVEQNNLEKTILLPQEKVNYFNRHKILKEASGIIVMTEDTLEANTTLRLRLRDVLLYKKPIICSNSGLLARYVRTHSIGLVVDNDTNSIIKAVEKLSTEKHTYKECLNSIEKLRNKHLLENSMLTLKDFIERNI